MLTLFELTDELSQLTNTGYYLWYGQTYWEGVLTDGYLLKPTGHQEYTIGYTHAEAKTYLENKIHELKYNKGLIPHGK